MSLGKVIKNLTSGNDIVREKTLAVKKYRDVLEVDKKKASSAKENVRSDSKSSSRTNSHGEKKLKHHQTESLTEESKTSTHHKKSSSSRTSKKYVTNNSSEKNSIESSHKRKESSSKHISYDPHLDVSEGYNPEYPDLFPGFKSIKREHETCESNQFHSSKSIKKEGEKCKPNQVHSSKSVKKEHEICEPGQFHSSKSIRRECDTYKPSVINNSTVNNSISCSLKRKEASLKHNSYDPHFDISEGYNPEFPDLFFGSKSVKKERETCEPDQFHSSKSIKRECDTYEPSVKRKLEVQTETVYESKPKKLKSDQISEKKDKHKKHAVQGSKSQSEKERSSNRKKENGDESLNDYLKEKSSVKSNSSKCVVKNKEKSRKKAKLKINSTVEFTSSEANFEDCLGLNDIVIKKKKSSKPVQTSPKTDNKTQLKVKAVSNKHSSSYSFHPASPKKSSSVQKEKFPMNVPKPEKIAKMEDINILSTLPQTMPNYRPLPRVESLPKKKEALSNEDAILFMSSKREKTAVYSGRKSYYTEVPSLFEICTRTLIDNIDYIDQVGNVPYHVLKPVLEKCNPQQLLYIENYNPYLLEDTDELWEIHCKRECKLHKLEENETYRELYLRAQDERKRKLKSITANISASMSKYNPARQVKLAYVDSFAKPPRDVARKQAKNGTVTPASQPVKANHPSKESPKPVASAVNSAPSVPNHVTKTSTAPNHVIKTKPKVAPLMAKTLKSMKLCFRR